MKDRHITGLYLTYWSLKDPLCQTQSLSYLRGLATEGHRFALMTFEQPRFRLTAAKARAAREELEREGIYWYPLRYHKRLPLLATAYDFVRGVFTGVYITLRHHVPIVHSRSSIAGAMALAISRICRIRFLYDADSRLSEEYADNAHWRRDSIQFRLLAWFERACRRRADTVVVLAHTLKDDFAKSLEVTAPIEVIPCCVDLLRFARSEDARAAVRAARRRELGLNRQQRLLVYVGKAGPRYLVRETFEFFKAVRGTIAEARLLVLSTDDPETFHNAACGAGLDRSQYWVKSSTSAGVVEWLAAADAGIALIRPAGCERGSSPIKIGEYLAAGLPTVITAGIGDYSELVSNERVGVVIGALDATGYRDAANELIKLWSREETLREKCRSFAAKAISLQQVGVPRYRSVYDRILGGVEIGELEGCKVRKLEG
jgi:glycosyltransferase involved in cell wall biosynthesis